MKNPKISFVCPSYNHEKFVNFFLQSVLEQTYQNFELIIIDDNSLDQTVAKIEKYTDNRIILLKNNFNSGINAGLNKAINQASGEYIVFIASDDVLEPNFLEVMVDNIEKNPDVGVFYQTLKVINEKGKYQKTISLKKKYTDKFSILKDNFYKSNRLASPGMMIKKSVMDKLLPLNVSMLQYQDYQMNILLLLQTEMYVESQPLVNYRKLDGNKNISAETDDTKKREMLEEYNLMNSFLTIKDVNLLRNIFKDDLQEFGDIPQEIIPYVLGRLALNSSKAIRKSWGYHTIMNFISEEFNFKLLNKLYGFTFKDFISLVKGVDFDSSSEYRKKYLKYKKLFKISFFLFILFFVLSIFLIIF